MAYRLEPVERICACRHALVASAIRTTCPFLSPNHKTKLMVVTVAGNDFISRKMATWLSCSLVASPLKTKRTLRDCSPSGSSLPFMLPITINSATWIVFCCSLAFFSRSSTSQNSDSFQTPRFRIVWASSSILSFPWGWLRSSCLVMGACTMPMISCAINSPLSMCATAPYFPEFLWIDFQEIKTTSWKQAFWPYQFLISWRWFHLQLGHEYVQQPMGAIFCLSSWTGSRPGLVATILHFFDGFLPSISKPMPHPVGTGSHHLGDGIPSSTQWIFRPGHSNNAVRRTSWNQPRIDKSGVKRSTYQQAPC